MSDQHLSDIEREAYDAIKTAVVKLYAMYGAVIDAPHMTKTAAHTLVKRAMKEIGAAKPMHDGRNRGWHVKAVFWSADNGRDLDKIEQSGESMVIGFEGIAVWLRDGAAYAYGSRRFGGLPDAMTIPALLQRLTNLRPSITRGKGRANMRADFETPTGEAAGLRLQITRADAMADFAKAEASADAGGDADLLRQAAELRRLQGAEP